MPNPFGALHVSDDEEEIVQKVTAKAAPAKGTSQPSTKKVVKLASSEPTSNENAVERIKEPRKNPGANSSYRPAKNERQSHDGRSSAARSSKRAGTGKGNWGKAGDEADVSIEPVDAPDTQASAEATAATGTEAAAPVEAAPKEPTYQEWKAQQEKSRIRVDASKLRKANEGTDTSK